MTLLSHSYRPATDFGFFLHSFYQKIKSLFFMWSCIPTYFLTGQIECHRALLHSCTQTRFGRGINDGVVLWTSETFRMGQGEQDTGRSPTNTHLLHHTDCSHWETVGLWASSDLAHFKKEAVGVHIFWLLAKMVLILLPFNNMWKDREKTLYFPWHFEPKTETNWM